MRFIALLRRPTVQHVLALAGGTAVAQIVNFFAAPFIARLYGPEAVGLAGMFLSLVTVLAVIAGGQYPLAIVLPKTEGAAVQLAALSSRLALAVSLVVLLVLLVFGDSLLELLNAIELLPFKLWIVIALCASVLLAIQTQWLISSLHDLQCWVVLSDVNTN